MSDTAWDAKGEADEDMETGVITRYLRVETGFKVPPAAWSACRSAAVTSLSAFDTHVADASYLNAEQKAWYAGLGQPLRAAIRRSAINLAA